MVRSSMSKAIARMGASSTSCPRTLCAASSSSPVASCSRPFSSSPAQQAGPPRSRSYDSSQSRSSDPLEPFRSSDPPSFAEWKSSAAARQFEKPQGTGPHWPSATPFPMNSAFTPPAPVAQSFRDEMWKLHSENPRKHGIRFLSSTFGLTVERVQAILRLKALESEMKAQSIPIQTEFQQQMETLMGSRQELPGRGGFKLRDQVPAPAEKSSASSGTSRGRLLDLEDSVQAEEEQATQGEQATSLAQALEKERASNASRSNAVETGGPDARALKNASQVRSRNLPLRPSPVADRSPLYATDLAPNRKNSDSPSYRSWESYSGAGTLAQNRKKAEKRQRSKARRSATSATA